MRRTRQEMRELEEVSALGELKNLSRVPWDSRLGKPEKHREGKTPGPGLFAIWGTGSSGNLLGEQGQGNLPQGPGDGQGRKA